MKQTIVNSVVYNDYYTRCMNLALTIFEWSGLPETCDARFLEKTLYEQGRAIFVKDETRGFLTLRALTAGGMNVYFVPTAYMATGNGYSVQYNVGENDNVLIRNNMLEYSTRPTVQLFAETLAELHLTMKVNRNAQKTPVLLLTNEKQRTTLENIYNQYEGDRPVIIGDKRSFSDFLITCVKTDAPYLLDKLYQDKMNVYNEFLTFLGINNANTDKRERLITSEVDSNNEFTFMSAETMLTTRQTAAAEINKKFGLNVTVRRKTLDEIKAAGEGIDDE